MQVLVCMLQCVIVALCIVQLGTDTWFYAKRCICSLIENMVRKLIHTYTHIPGNLNTHSLKWNAGKTHDHVKG